MTETIGFRGALYDDVEPLYVEIEGNPAGTVVFNRVRRVFVGRAGLEAAMVRASYTPGPNEIGQASEAWYDANKTSFWQFGDAVPPGPGPGPGDFPDYSGTYTQYDADREIVFLGDSRFENGGETSPNIAHPGWEAVSRSGRVFQPFDGQFAFGGITIVECRDTYLPQAIATGVKNIALLIGTNSLNGNDLAAMQSQMGDIFSDVNAAGGRRLWVLNETPQDHAPSANTDKHKAFSDWLLDPATYTSYGNMEVVPVDTWSALAMPDNTINPIYDYGDALHLSVLGAQVAGDAFGQAINSYFDASKTFRPLDLGDPASTTLLPAIFEGTGGSNTFGDGTLPDEFSQVKHNNSSRGAEGVTVVTSGDGAERQIQIDIDYSSGDAQTTQGGAIEINSINMPWGFGTAGANQALRVSYEIKVEGLGGVGDPFEFQAFGANMRFGPSGQPTYRMNDTWNKSGDYFVYTKATDWRSYTSQNYVLNEGISDIGYLELTLNFPGEGRAISEGGTSTGRTQARVTIRNFRVELVAIQ